MTKKLSRWIYIYVLLLMLFQCCLFTIFTIEVILFVTASTLIICVLFLVIVLMLNVFIIEFYCEGVFVCYLCCAPTSFRCNIATKIALWSLKSKLIYNVRCSMLKNFCLEKKFIEFLRSRAARIFEAHQVLNKNAVWEGSEDPSKSSKEKIYHGNFDWWRRLRHLIKN